MNYDVSLQTIAWINGRRVDETLEISPKFQRRAVWLEAERKALIETIMSGLPFPEIYIQQQTDANTGTERHIVVDGQQRVTSILMFIDGQFPLPIVDAWTGEHFADLDEVQKARFWNYKVVVRGLSNASDAEIRDLFQRLNTNNVALNDQELRNARFKGRFKQASEAVADNALFLSLGLFTARDIRRMLDVEFASELLVTAIFGVTNKKDVIDQAYGEFEEDFPNEAEFVGEVETSLALIRSVITDANKTAIKTRSNFYSLFGACLRYHRFFHRTSFHRTDAVAQRLTDLLLSVRAAEFDGKPPFYGSYFEAVSRAASDRGRRATREEILYDVIVWADAGAAPQDGLHISPEQLAQANPH